MEEGMKSGYRLPAYHLAPSSVLHYLASPETRTRPSAGSRTHTHTHTHARTRAHCTLYLFFRPSVRPLVRPSVQIFLQSVLLWLCLRLLLCVSLLFYPVSFNKDLRLPPVLPSVHRSVRLIRSLVLLSARTFVPKSNRSSICPFVRLSV